jgi:hypothetical protein
MEHGALVLEDPPAARQQLLVAAPPGLPNDLPVGVGPLVSTRTSTPRPTASQSASTNARRGAK